MPNLLSKLINRKDNISITNGRLVIEPASGKPIPDDWLEENWFDIVKDAALLTGRNCFSYQEHKIVKNYFPDVSIRLEFISLVTGESIPMFFKVHTERAKDSKYGKKGNQLPQGSWRLPSNSGLRTIWPFPKPRRNSEYCEKIWQFKHLIFDGNITPKGKLSKDTFKPLEIAMSEITSATRRQLIGNTSATDRQTSRQEKPVTQITEGLHPNSTGCDIPELKSNKVSEYESNPSPASFSSITEHIQAISNEKWLSEYNAGNLH